MHHKNLQFIVLVAVSLLLCSRYCLGKSSDADVEDDEDDDFSQDKIVQWVKIVQTSLTAPLKSHRNKKVDSKRFLQSLSRQMDEWAKDAILEEVEEKEIRNEFWKEMNPRIATLINSQQRQGIFSEELADELRRALDLLKTDLYDQVRHLRQLIAENDHSTFITKAGKVSPGFEKIANAWKDLVMAGIKFITTDDHQFYTVAGMLIGQWVTSVIKQLPDHKHIASQWRAGFWNNFTPQMNRYFDNRPDEQKNGVLVIGVLKSIDALINGKRNSEMMEIFDGFWIDIDEKYSDSQKDDKQKQKQPAKQKGKKEEL